jgi:hypothetical protein
MCTQRITDAALEFLKEMFGYQVVKSAKAGQIQGQNEATHKTLAGFPKRGHEVKVFSDLRLCLIFCI